MTFLDSTLHIDNLTLCYRDTTLLHSLSLSLTQGTITTLLGPSGSGKTLFSLALQGLIPPNITQKSGTISLDTKPINATLYRGKVFASVMQNPRTCFNPLYTIQSHIKETLYAHKKPYDNARIESILQQVGLESNVLGLYSFEMSGGMIQRVMIAIALLLETPFLIADEPSSDLDSIVWHKIVELLIKLCKTHHLGILLVTHDLALAAKISDSIVLINQGKILRHYQKNECNVAMLESIMKAMY